MTNVTPAATSTEPSSTTTTPKTEASNPNSALGQNAFLKLMIAQMQSQDPLEPSGSDTEYVSELASFTELEQITNLANSNEMNSAVQMIGKSVTYTNSAGKTDSGTVETVESGHEGPTLTIGGVSGIAQSSVTEIT